MSNTRTSQVTHTKGHVILTCVYNVSHINVSSHTCISASHLSLSRSIILAHVAHILISYHTHVFLHPIFHAHTCISSPRIGLCSVSIVSAPHLYLSLPIGTGWQQLVGSLNLHVSFSKEPYENRALFKTTCYFRKLTDRCHSMWDGKKVMVRHICTSLLKKRPISVRLICNTFPGLA